MLKPATIELRKLIRKAAISTLMIAMFGLAFASKGGGGKKENNNNIPLKTEFVPIRTTNNFTLKSSGLAYRGTYSLGQEKTKSYVSIHSLVTYEKGNSLYIIPYKYKMNTSVYLNGDAGKSNLQMLDLRIKMHN
jgi:hypothetical protein